MVIEPGSGDVGEVGKECVSGTVYLVHWSGSRDWLEL